MSAFFIGLFFGGMCFCFGMGIASTNQEDRDAIGTLGVLCCVGLVISMCVYYMGS